MNLKQIVANVARVDKFLKSGEIKAIADEIITKKLEPRVIRRIFEQGRDSANKLIGKYSTNPLNVDISQFPMFASQLRPYRRKIKTGKRGRPKLTNFAFFQGGYKAFRKAVGRQNQKVDLHLTGKTKQAVQIIRKGNRVVLSVRTQKARTILDENERRFNTRIIDFTRFETKMFATELQAKINSSISKIIKKGAKR